MKTTITLKHQDSIHQMVLHTKESNDTIKAVFASVWGDWEILGIRRGDIKKTGE